MPIRVYKLKTMGVVVAESEDEPEASTEDFTKQLEYIEEGTYELVIEER